MTELKVSRVIIPPDRMASLALMPKFRMVDSICVGSTKAGQWSPASAVCNLIVPPNVALRRSLSSTILLLRSTSCDSSRCLREKARSWVVSLSASFGGGADQLETLLIVGIGQIA
jgi:hypothetical protein